MNSTNQTGLFIHVRPGFEKDASKELLFKLGTLLNDNNAKFGQQELIVKDKDLSGFVSVQCSGETIQRLRSDLKLKELIFARQLLWSSVCLTIPKLGDRVTTIIDHIVKNHLVFAGCNAFSGFEIETTESDESKELSGFCKSIQRPLENALNKAKLLPKGKGAAHLPRLVLVMSDPETVWICIADNKNSSHWPMGIPRLKFPTDAPSRSTLKLEEAFVTLLGPEELGIKLCSGMTAVDLGACPGGWTYQLVSRGVHVVAVDNGVIDDKLMKSGLVVHEMEDAFKFRPLKPVDWMVCDVVEQPARITALMEQWIINGWCHHTIFNLKLPMNLRWEEVNKCMNQISENCAKKGKQIEIKAKHLYHDRKEITVYCALR
ncbi:MAG: 23S rRNA (cytidine(2498)-2'-O)-methyltransferase RlmM [Proteobacteria bacterium]|nr:23S rRNA (cytidine(2498)-2'-O)-methyltransferase RlmM [Pseudomonadota bacterium]